MTLEQQLRASVELTKCSEDLREFVRSIQIDNAALRRQLGLARLSRDLEEDQRNLDAAVPALLRPQA